MKNDHLTVWRGYNVGQMLYYCNGNPNELISHICKYYDINSTESVAARFSRDENTYTFGLKLF